MDDNPYHSSSIPADQENVETKGQRQVDWVGLVLLAVVGAFASGVFGILLWVVNRIWP